MTNITQNIRTVVALPTPPNPNVPATFDELGYAYTVAQNEFGLSAQGLADDLNAFREQVNMIAGEVAEKATEAQHGAETSTQKASEAAQSAIDAAAAVASLPEGSIIDTGIYSDKTWSSQKILSLFSIDETITHLAVTGATYVDGNLVAMTYLGGYETTYEYDALTTNLSSVLYKKDGATELTITYTYDASGNLLTTTRS